MRFYQFPEITSRDRSLATRAKRTSYAQKLSDTFYLFSGPMLGLSFENGMRLRPLHNAPYRYNNFTFGLLDYPLFILKFARYGLFKLARYANELIKDENEIIRKYEENPTYEKPSQRKRIGAHALFWSTSILFSILSLIHFAISGFFTLLCSPIVFFVHRYYKAEGDKLREALDKGDEDNNKLDSRPQEYLRDCGYCNIKDIGNNRYEKHYYTPTFLQNMKFCLYSSIDAIRFVRLANNEVVKFIYLNNTYLVGSDYGKRCVVFRDTPQGNEAFRAFVALNIADYEKFRRNHPLLEESQRSTYSLARRDLLIKARELSRLSACSPKNDDAQQIELPDNYLPKEVMAQILLATANDAEKAGVKKERILHLVSLFAIKNATPELTPKQAPLPTATI